MPTVNYAEKYSKQIDQVYTHVSYVAPVAGVDYDFTGVATLNVFSPETVPLTDYDPDEGYGNPKRMGNTVQEMTVTQDKKFTLIIDKKDKLSTNGTMEAGSRLKQQLNEQVVPTQDKYALAQFVKHAGKIVGVAAPTTDKAVYKMLLAARGVMNNSLVPNDGRYCFIGSTYAGNLIDSGVVVANPQIAGKSYTKGDIGKVLGFKVIEIPDNYLPEGCYMLCVHRNSILNPHKIQDASVMKSEMYNGDRMNGRFLYDAFVMGKKAVGVYAAVENGKKQADPTISVSGGVATFTSEGAEEIKYTLDGSDPRYSKEAKTVQSGGTATVDAAKVKEIKAVAYGTFTSNVASKTVE